jgi:hypothetical protein
MPRNLLKGNSVTLAFTRRYTPDAVNAGQFESFPGSHLHPCPELASETFAVPNPLVVGRKSRSHVDEQQSTQTLTILSEEKDESEQRVSPLRIKRNKLAVA